MIYIVLILTFKLDIISKYGMKSTVWTYIYTLIQKLGYDCKQNNKL